ncbi:hypothetical protein GCM10011404_32130 [Sphingomonas prati]|nr:hypothetical protein GCM10011404_32130 [Sphingomonas prati]
MGAGGAAGAVPVCAMAGQAVVAIKSVDTAPARRKPLSDFICNPPQTRLFCDAAVLMTAC